VAAHHGDVRAEGAGPRVPRVAIADDNQVVLEEICQLLASEFDIVCAVQESVALVEAVAFSKPDAVVTDLDMPGLNGIETAQKLFELGMSPAVVILTVYNDPHMIQRALRAGIRGYVLKDDAGEELVAALRAVTAGNRYLSRGALAAIT